MDSSVASFETELRHIKASTLDRIASIIDHANGFDDLLSAISRPLPLELCQSKQDPLRMTPEQVDIIKNEIYRGRSPSLALLKHWSITGRTRPTLLTLFSYLKLSRLERAADLLHKELLCKDEHNQYEPKKFIPDQIESPPKPLDSQTNPAKDTGYNVDVDFLFKDLIDVLDRPQEKYQIFSFDNIYNSTNKFCHQPFDPITSKGTRIGDGKFSAVFRANVNPPNEPQEIVAVKLLKSECNREYLKNELDLARRIKHDNVLVLLGLSYNINADQTGSLCLIYPYIQNGSLQKCLGQGLMCRNFSFLNCDQRYNVALGVAKGIDYLHNFDERPIIHRDIKTANILIDIDVNPKIGDFTLVRQLEFTTNGDTRYTSNVIGTSIYMPPEAFRGDISTKFDIYSFGVVLLELLTGMKPFNLDSEEDLLTFMCDKLADIDDLDESVDQARDSFYKDILDKKAGTWNLNNTKLAVQLALKATEGRKAHRPAIGEILRDLEKLGSLTAY